jgi:hypothetical protein
MLNNKFLASTKIIWAGILASAVLTALIAWNAEGLSGFEIIGKTVPFAYPWRLVDPTALSRLTAWVSYVFHNLIVWVIISAAKREKPKYSSNLRWFNWALIITNLGFVLIHLLQSHIWYDGLAQDVPEITALGSVALMLMVILILETPRRGLILGQKTKFHRQFLRIVREYHGYLFSWAIVYTFWYHPTEGTIGHLAGFFYMFMLFVQSALIFNRAHLNKWWTVTLEVLVLIHAVLVALLQGNAMWPMFAFGFGGMIVLTQMFGLGFNARARWMISVGYFLLAFGTYAYMGRLSSIHEILRIPLLDYLVVFLLYGIFLGVLGLTKAFRRPPLPEFPADQA